MAVESVGPEEPGRLPEQAPGEEHDAAHVGSTVEAVVEDTDPEPWRVHSGETLREVLGRWGGRAGIEILFLTDRRYRLHEGRTFAGPFPKAADALLAHLSHLPHPPVGERRSDGRTLAVLHRSRPAGDGQ